VIDGGAAARAGLEPGDRVLEIDGRAIRYWEEIEEAVRSSPGEELHLRIHRNGKTFERYLTPIEDTVRHRDGQVQSQGRVGITHAPFVPLVGVIDGASPAARSGLRTRDLIISVDGQAVRNWRDVQRQLGRFARRTSIVYFRGTEVPGVPQIELLGAGFADLVPETQIDATLNRQTYTGLEHAEIGRDEFVLAVPRGHVLSRSLGPVRAAELDGEPVLLLADGHCFRDQALAFCSRAGADELGFRATSLSTLAQMAAGGAGLTLLPRLSVPIENRRGALVVRPFAPPVPARTLALVWRPRSPVAPALKPLAAALGESLRRVAAARASPGSPVSSGISD